MIEGDYTNRASRDPARPETGLVRYAGVPVDQVPVSAASEQSPAQFDLYAFLIGALRGRYLLISALAVVCAAGLAIPVWMKTKPSYRSEGLVQIAYTRPYTFNPVEPNQPLQLYSEYLRAQVLRIGSREILERALEDPAWRATGNAKSADWVEYIAENLVVDRVSGTDHIRVTVQSEYPEIAAAAVRAIVNTYQEEFVRTEAERESARMQKVTSHTNELASTASGLRQKLSETEANSTGITDELYQAAIDEVKAHDTQIREIQVALAMVSGKEPAQAARILSIEQIAFIDPVVQRKLDERKQLQAKLADFDVRGYGPAHRERVQVQRESERLQQEIETDAENFRQRQATLPPPQPGNVGGPLNGMIVPAEALRKQLEVRTTFRDQAKQVLEGKSQQRAKMKELRTQLDKVEKELEDAKKLQTSLSLESNPGGRLSVISYGNVPLSPFQDKRARYAGAAAVVGAGMPVGLIVLSSFLFRRYRYSDETATDMQSKNNVRLLGVVPTVPERTHDRDKLADVVQSVHQLRVMLQLSHSDAGKGTYLVTSASAGEGKTSLAVALAMSYAASGTSTLVVDADWVSQQLTRGFGFENAPGLREGIESGRAYIREVRKNLWALPAGQVSAMHACTVSSASIAQLLSEAKRRFDVILIDTGPILGSVEASVFAQQADGVILVVARGQQPALVERATKHLASIGARVTGAVFNRAVRADFYRSFQPSSIATGDDERFRPAEPESPNPFGPLVQAMAVLTPTGDEVHEPAQ